MVYQFVISLFSSLPFSSSFNIPIFFSSSFFAVSRSLHRVKSFVEIDPYSVWNGIAARTVRDASTDLHSSEELRRRNLVQPPVEFSLAERNGYGRLRRSWVLRSPVVGLVFPFGSPPFLKWMEVLIYREDWRKMA